MNLITFTSDWIIRSLAIGGLAAACVFLCPAAWRSRLRRSVPAVAFVMLLVLPLWKFAPVKIDAPAAVAGLAAAAPSDDWQWLALVWIAGATVCLARMLSGVFAIRSLLDETCAVPGGEWADCLAAAQEMLGIRGRVHLRLAGPGFIPSATGLFRRTILLPDEALHWTVEQRRLVLLHELGHFRRGDLWIHAMGRFACALHWFNPFVWALQHQLSLEREYAVDELVVEHGVAPADYATVLWEMAKSATRRPSAAAAYLAMAQRQPGKLEQRVRRILAPARRTSRMAGALDAIVASGAVALLVFCAVCRPAASASPAGYPVEEIKLRLGANPFPGEAP
jgi:beta-lactamase regulating signal transducer with metallopeptidase domain